MHPALPLRLARLEERCLPAVTVGVDANLNVRAIDPRIYGVAWAGTAQLGDLNSPTNRWGGNTTTRYNWLANADNRGADWYFQSLPYPSPTPGAEADSFIQSTHKAGAEAIITIPMAGYVATLGPGRSRLASYSIAKYGPQTGNDWQWFPDAGNGIRAGDNALITWNNPLDANVVSTPAFQQSWVQHLQNKWGGADAGGGRGMDADFTWNFHRLFGDADGNGAVNFIDFLAFRSSFGKSDPVFDADGNGTVDFQDFLQFRSCFGTAIVP